MCDTSFDGMIIELILWYWIGLTPCEKTDEAIGAYMEKMNLTPEAMVKLHNFYEKYGTLDKSPDL